MFKRLSALALAFVLMLSCSIPALAYEVVDEDPRELEEIEELEHLIPVYMEEPPMGVRSDYVNPANQVGDTIYGNTTMNVVIGSISFEIFYAMVKSDPFFDELPEEMDQMIHDQLYSMYTGLMDEFYQTGDEYALQSLPYVQKKYSSRYPGCYCIVRYYDISDNVTVPVEYYIMYI